MSYARRSDNTSKGIASWFRGLGCSVTFIRSIASGCPDLLVGEPQTASDHQVECKTPGNVREASTTGQDQKTYRELWRGAPVERALNQQDVVDLVKKWRGKSG